MVEPELSDTIWKSYHNDSNLSYSYQAKVLFNILHLIFVITRSLKVLKKFEMVVQFRCERQVTSLHFCHSTHLTTTNFDLLYLPK